MAVAAVFAVGLAIVAVLAPARGPFVLAAGLIFVLASFALLLIGRPVVRARRGACFGCGHPLVAQTRCPECGLAADDIRGTWPNRFGARVRRHWLAWLIVLVLPCGAWMSLLSQHRPSVSRPAAFETLRPGVSAAEVWRQVGGPKEFLRSSGGHEAWRYRVGDPWDDYFRYVHLMDGVMTHVH